MASGVDTLCSRSRQSRRGHPGKGLLGAAACRGGMLACRTHNDGLRCEVQLGAAGQPHAGCTGTAEGCSMQGSLAAQVREPSLQPGRPATACRSHAKQEQACLKEQGA